MSWIQRIFGGGNRTGKDAENTEKDPASIVQDVQKTTPGVPLPGAKSEAGSMGKDKTYDNVRFTPEVIQQAARALEANATNNEKDITVRLELSIDLESGESWTHNSPEEFFADYRKGFKSAKFQENINYGKYLIVWARQKSSEVWVRMPDRPVIEHIFGIFESHVAECTLGVPLQDAKSEAGSLGKDKTYDRVIFTPEVIQQAARALEENASSKEKNITVSLDLNVNLETGEKWTHNSPEEFFADYRKGFKSAHFTENINYGKYRLEVWAYKTSPEVSVKMPDRPSIEHIFGIFESHVAECTLPTPVTQPQEKTHPKVFIGHGRNPLRKDLKDHLHDLHGLDVEAYEMGARGGLTIKEVLDDMLTKSSFAILVFTGEDMDANGQAHARENVIHELGLFQGHLGWSRAVVLLEDGVNEISNIHGTNQIRFQRGNIRETFGEVLATIKREFSEK